MTLTMTKLVLKELEPKHDSSTKMKPYNSSTKMKPYNSWNMHVNMRNSENEMSSVL
jgi:hypothetical protein